METSGMKWLPTTGVNLQSLHGSITQSNDANQTKYNLSIRRTLSRYISKNNSRNKLGVF